MERYFNIAGPCIPGEHYMLPALDRLSEIRRLVSRRQYFVIHAPRQTGKTTAMQALVREINAKGEMVAIYCTLETLQNATDIDNAMPKLKRLLLQSANAVPALAGSFAPNGGTDGCEQGASWMVTAISDTLTDLCRRAGKPLVVFFDEADCLFGNVLISFLRQLRAGFVNRATIPFPASIALVGMLDVRDYKAQIRQDGESLGQISPFNIISEDMLLRNFTAEEVAALYAQHTEETGQNFAPDVLDKVMEFSGGQPWLVNALARECVEKIHDFRYNETVTADDIETAKETIIGENPIHLDYLFDMVNSQKIRYCFDACIQGTVTEELRVEVPFKVLQGLGFLREDDGGFDFSNLLYREYWKRRTGLE